MNISKILLIIFPIFFIFFATVVFSAESLSFPNDPTQAPLPSGVRPSASFGESFSPESSNLPEQSFYENYENFYQDSPNVNNNSQNNNLASYLIPALIAFIIFVFLVVIFFIARSIFFKE